MKSSELPVPQWYFVVQAYELHQHIGNEHTQVFGVTSLVLSRHLLDRLRVCPRFLLSIDHSCHSWQGSHRLIVCCAFWRRRELLCMIRGYSELRFRRRRSRRILRGRGLGHGWVGRGLFALVSPGRSGGICSGCSGWEAVGGVLRARIGVLRSRRYARRWLNGRSQAGGGPRGDRGPRRIVSLARSRRRTVLDVS